MIQRCACEEPRCADAQSGEAHDRRHKHPKDWQCHNKAVRLVTTRTYVPETDSEWKNPHIPMCAACAEWHEKSHAL